MARGTGIVPAARMIQMKVEMHGDIEDGFRFPMLAVGHLPVFELE
jgi:hypothetical protein